MSKKVSVGNLKNIWNNKGVIGGKPVEPFALKKPGQMNPLDKSRIVQQVEPNIQIASRAASRRLVLVATPYASEDLTMLKRHINYARYCVQDCLSKGEAPLSIHLVLNQMMNDRVPLENDAALITSASWLAVSDVLAVYSDYGVSPGMQTLINQAMIRSKRVEYRLLGKIVG